MLFNPVVSLDKLLSEINQTPEVLWLVSGALVPVLSLFGIAAFCITFVAPLGSGMAVTTEQSAKMLRALSPQSKENGDTK